MSVGGPKTPSLDWSEIPRASGGGLVAVGLLALFSAVFLSVGAVAYGATPTELGGVESEDSVAFHGSFSPRRGLVLERGEDRLEVHGYTWIKAATKSLQGAGSDFDVTVPVGRLFLTGAAFDSRLSFFAQQEFVTGKTQLIDFFVGWEFSEAFSLRVGQFRSPYSRAFITPLTNLQLPTRGLVIDRFGLGRTTGVMASGNLAAGRYHYDLAVVNWDTVTERKRDRDALAVIVRNELRFGDTVPYDQAPSLSLENPHGLAFGLGGAYTRRSLPDRASREETWNAAFDAAWMHGPASLRFESFLRSAENSSRQAKAFGAYSQLGVFVVPRRIEIGGRVGGTSEGADVMSYEAFVASYWHDALGTLGHHLKTTLGYRFDTGAPGSGDPSSGDLRDRHNVVVQTQVFF